MKVINDIIGVYGLYCRPSKKWYVGRSKHVYQRWKDYTKLKCGKQIKLYRALKKYGIDNFDFIVLEERQTSAGLKSRENYWIDNKDSVINGYNCYGAGNTPTNVCKETRLKISEGLKNSKKLHIIMNTDEYRKKLSDAKLGNQIWLGRKHTLKTRKKMSLSMMGNKSSLGIRHTEERKRNQSEKMIGNTFNLGKRDSIEVKERKRQAAILHWKIRKLQIA